MVAVYHRFMSCDGIYKVCSTWQGKFVTSSRSSIKSPFSTLSRSFPTLLVRDRARHYGENILCTGSALNVFLGNSIEKYHVDSLLKRRFILIPVRGVILRLSPFHFYYSSEFVAGHENNPQCEKSVIFCEMCSSTPSIAFYIHGAVCLDRKGRSCTENSDPNYSLPRGVHLRTSFFHK